MEDQKSHNPDLTDRGEKLVAFSRQKKDATLVTRSPDPLSREAPLETDPPGIPTPREVRESAQRSRASVVTENQPSKLHRQNTTELERSNRDLDAFAHTISHDLQEPLRTLTAFAELLQTRYQGKLDLDAHKFINQIVSNSNRMRGMIQDLLRYSRIQAEGTAFEPVDVEKVVLAAIANLGAGFPINTRTCLYHLSPICNN